MEWANIFDFDKVKEESRLMYQLCVRRAESIGHAEFIRTDGRVSLAAVYKTDMLNFLVYLAYSDGRMSKDELRYINSLMELQFNEQLISGYADRWGLKTETIKDRPPMSLEPFVRSNIGPETGEISDSYYDLISLYVTTFNYIGNDLISVSRELAQGKIEALSSYIFMLRYSIDEINGRITDYKPTIEFKRGSSIKSEPKPEYVRAAEEAAAQGGYAASKTDMFGGDRLYRDDKVNKASGGGIIKTSDSAYAGADEAAADYDNDIDEIKRVIDTDEVNIEVLLEELNGLTGMAGVKVEINNLINLLKVCRIRKEKGLKTPPTTNHLVFIGNPGTGKTTVARILAKIYRGLGILSKGHLVEVDRSGLVAGYMGQTGEKVMEVVNRAKGGILFIDEAYALASGKQEGDFGREAIDILNKAMEDYRDDLIVIAAGYHDEMQDFLDANPGLRSRFNRTIEFPDYSAEELVTIMTDRAAKLDYRFAADALEYCLDMFKSVLANPPENFGNARSARNYLDRIINKQANRLVNEAAFKEDELMLIKLCDVEHETL